jgi:hypothetical protein
VPDGSLDRYVFPPEDEAYELIDPDRHDEPAARAVVLLLARARPRREHADVRRAARAGMSRSSGKPAEDWGLNGASQVERAVARAEVSRWIGCARPDVRFPTMHKEAGERRTSSRR